MVTDTALHECLRGRWLGLDADDTYGPLNAIRAEVAEAAKRRDGTHPIIDGIRREAVVGPLWRGIPMLPGSDSLGLLTLHVGDKLEIFPTSFSKEIYVAARFALMRDEPNTPVLIRATTSRVDGKLSGIDLRLHTALGRFNNEHEVICGGHFQCTKVETWPPLVHYEAKGPVRVVTLCQTKVW
jgi:hypothetical protein